MFNKSRLMAACASVLLAGGIASQAQAATGLQINLNLAADGSSTTITHVGQEINVEVWARVEGAGTATKKQGFQMLSGSFLSSGGAQGIFTPTGAPIDTPGGGMEVGVGLAGGLGNFNGNGSQRGWSVNLDTDGDKDMGGPGTDDTQIFGHTAIRANGMVQNPTSGAAGKIFNLQIGSLKYTVTDVSVSGNTTLNFVDRRNAAGQQISGSALWQQDGASKNVSNSTLTINGLTLTNAADVNAPGNSQGKPVMADSTVTNGGKTTETFTDVTSGVWTDPDANRITYNMISVDSDFTGIVAFPTGFGAMTITLLNVDTDGDLIGETIPAGVFNAGDTLSFGDVLVAGLPLAAYGVAVDSFEIVTAIPGVQGGFPLAISLSTATATFSATYDAIPEPATLGVLALGSLLGLRRRRQA